MRKFLLSRWRGDVPLSAVLWGDMIVIGTALNILASLASVALLVYGASTAMALTARITAIIWLVAVTVI